MSGLDYSLDPYGVQAAQIAQRQRLAQMMIDQGMSNTPVYSDKAGIAKALMIAMGQYDQGRVGQQMVALAKQKQADQQGEMDRIIAAATGGQGPASAAMGGGSAPAAPGGATVAPDGSAPAGGAPAGSPAAPGAGRFALAQILAKSEDPTFRQAGLGMLLKGPDAPIVKEAGGKVFVISPDGRTVLNTIGSSQISPPSVADATPESLAEYQRTGDASVLKTRIKQIPVDNGGSTTFVNPEAPPGAPIPKSMTPGEAASTGLHAAELADKGVALPGNFGGGGGGPPQPGVRMPSGGPLNYGDMGNVSPATQAARDDQRLQMLLQERQSLAANGQRDPALETEIAAMQRQNTGGGPAPAAPGVQGLSPADARAVAASTAQGLAKGGVDYKVGLDTRVQAGADLMSRINESEKALAQFQPGMGSETRLQLARFAQDVLQAPDLAKRINAGDISAKQEFQKLAAQQAMESLKQAMGGTGRITQAEFKIFQQNNPNIELDPGAIGKIFQFSRSTFLRDQGEQQSLYDYLQRGGQIGYWPAVWAQKQVENGLVPGQGGPGVQASAPSVDDLIRKYSR